MQTCKRCVMNDSLDDKILFTETGCNYCDGAVSQLSGKSLFGNGRAPDLSKVIDDMKKSGRKKLFDCVIAMDGDIGTSFLAYYLHRQGLRLLGVHVEDGFCSEQSKSNIKKVADKTEMRLLTIKQDSNQVNSLFKAYLKAAVPNITAPQKNFTLATVIDCAKKYDIKFVLTGKQKKQGTIKLASCNIDKLDTQNILDIGRKHGSTPFDQIKFVSRAGLGKDKLLQKIKIMQLLDLIDFDSEKAAKELQEFCDFEQGDLGKANYFSAFEEFVWLPEKFGVDTRHMDFSSKIVADEMSRDEAETLIGGTKHCSSVQKEKIRQYVAEKLGIDKEQFSEIMASENKQNKDFKVTTSKVATVAAKAKSMFEGKKKG